MALGPLRIDKASEENGLVWSDVVKYKRHVPLLVGGYGVQRGLNMNIISELMKHP